MDWLKVVHSSAPSAVPATLRPGDEVRVWYKIREQDNKERLGQFEGVVIRCRGSGAARTFTVRRVTYGEGVERIFPFDSRTIVRVEVLRQGRARRSRLYFLRTVIGKARLDSSQQPIQATEERASGTPSSASAPAHAKTGTDKPQRPADMAGVDKPVPAKTDA